MRTKALAAALAAATTVASLAFAPTASAKSPAHPGRPASAVNRPIVTLAENRATPSPTPTSGNSQADFTGLLASSLSGLGFGLSAASSDADDKGWNNGRGNSGNSGRNNEHGSGSDNGWNGDRSNNRNDQGNGRLGDSGNGRFSGRFGGNGLTGGGGPVSVASTSSTPTTSSTSAAPSSSPAVQSSSSDATHTPQDSPAANSSPTPHLASAPDEAPSLSPQRTPSSSSATQSSAPRQVAYPTGMNDVEDGTAVLVGVLIVFLIGVVSVVVSAGYRSRRANHRSR